MSRAVPTGIFGQYWLNQLHRRNLTKHGFKYKPMEFRKRGEMRNIRCALCGKDKDTVVSVSPFKVSPEGLMKMTPQPQMLICGIYRNKHGEAIDICRPPSQFNTNVIIPYYDKQGIRCPMTGKQTHLYYIVKNAFVCRKCIWHKLGNKKGKLKVAGETVEY